MSAYIFKRLCLLFFLVLAVSTVAFFLIHLLPGDPVAAMLGSGASGEDIQRLRHELNLDQPLVHQYLDFMKNLVNFSFGTSISNHQTVFHNISAVLPRTISLATASMLLAVILSFPLGTLAAFKDNTLVDASVTLISSVGLAIPNFVLGPLLILFFSIHWGWLPVSGTGSVNHMILPVLTLGTSMSAFLTRIIRSALGTQLKKPYVLLARARGLTEFQVFRQHLLKNAMIPIITTAGLQLGALLTGAVITETVFSWPGLGSLLTHSIKQRDYPMVQGIIVFIALVYLILNFLVDLSYFALDPRIRPTRKKRFNT